MLQTSTQTITCQLYTPDVPSDLALHTIAICTMWHPFCCICRYVEATIIITTLTGYVRQVRSNTVYLISKNRMVETLVITMLCLTGQ